MKRWQWYGQQLIAAAGLPGMVGVVMILAAGLLQLGLIQPARHEISQRQADLTQARNRPHVMQTAGPEQQVARFYDFFPAPQALSQQLRTLHQVTEAQEMFMGKVDYKLSRVSGTPLKRYEVSYSLLTDYPSLRVYLAELLRALPNAALEDIELQRFNEGAEMLEAKLQLALYFRHGL
jgi:hypothetical protein